MAKPKEIWTSTHCKDRSIDGQPGSERGPPKGGYLERGRHTPPLAMSPQPQASRTMGYYPCFHRQSTCPLLVQSTPRRDVGAPG
eukprot:6225257-Pyramimonas_sp.AAC.1